MNKLAVFDTIKEGIKIGTKNIGPIVVNVLLFILTAWIPYINVGTTIGLTVGIVSKASKGETIPMTEIFDPKYRKYMGEYFLTSGLIGAGVFIGSLFAFIPGIVIAIAWSLAILLVVDKGKNPTEAITLSNNCTYGYKARMFGVYFLVSLIFSVAMLLISGMSALLVRLLGFAALGFSAFLSAFLMILLAVFAIFVFIGLQASIYRQLTEGV